MSLVLVLLLALPVAAQDVGDTVVVIADNEAELRVSGRTVGAVRRGNHLTIEKSNGDWFWVNNDGKRGWINRRNVISSAKAIDFFTAAIKRNPNADNYTCRGMAWATSGEFDIAIGDFNEAIRFDPSSADAFYNRGAAWQMRGDAEKAIGDANEAIRLDPEYSIAFVLRGKAQKAKGEFSKAISDYDKAIRLDSDNVYPYNSIAWLCATCPDSRYRNGQKAIKHARTACKMWGWKDAANLDTLAAAYAENGDFNKAVEWQQKVIDLAPSEEKADYRSRLELYKSGKPYREEPKK